jgi:hypothetical protein
MTFRQRTLQLFFLFLGVVFVGMFVVRWLAPNSRSVLWSVLCPPDSRIEITFGEAELEPGEIVGAYEVSCVGRDFRLPLTDIQLLLVETVFSIGLAVFLAIFFGWITTRGAVSRASSDPITPHTRN